MKFSAKLRDKYAQEIQSWDWDALTDVEGAYIFVNDCGDVVASHYVGDVATLSPSGKIYAPWTTNQTVRDVIRDRAFYESLEEIALDFGCYVEYESGYIHIVHTLDGAGEAYYHDGEAFYRMQGERVADCEADLEALMDSEGFYPNVYILDGRGDIAGFYEWGLAQ